MNWVYDTLMIIKKRQQIDPSWKRERAVRENLKDGGKWTMRLESPHSHRHNN